MLTRGTAGALYQPPDKRKEAGAMVTYDDLFNFITMICSVVTLVITIFMHKK